MMFLIGWNLAAGYWSRLGLSPVEAKELMSNFARQLGDDPLKTVKESRPHIQQALMALRKEPFEAIQGEAPFRPHAQANMKRLLNAYMNGGVSAFDDVWRQVFPDGQEVEPADYQPIRCGRRGRRSERNRFRGCGSARSGDEGSGGVVVSPVHIWLGVGTWDARHNHKGRDL